MTLPDLAKLGETHDVTISGKVSGETVTFSFAVKPRKPIRRSSVSPPDRTPEQNANTKPPTNGQPPRSMPPSGDEDRQALNLLRSVGVDLDTAVKLLAFAGPERCIEVSHVAMSKKHPSGFTVQALRQDWNVNREQTK